MMIKYMGQLNKEIGPYMGQLNKEIGAWKSGPLGCCFVLSPDLEMVGLSKDDSPLVGLQLGFRID